MTVFVPPELEAAGGLVRAHARRGKILLAVSGGGDSMALLRLAAACCDPESLWVGWVNHGLRPEVEAEWEVVRSACAAVDVGCDRLELQPPGSTPEGGWQQWARDARYRALAALARRVGAGAVVTAHTADDLAETVLLRLARGTGIPGLAAMESVRPLADDVLLVRPLLSVARAALRAWLDRLGQAWIDEPSNDNPRFARVRVRTRVLPALREINPQVVRHLASLAQDAAAVRDWMDAVWSDRLVRTHVGDGVWLPRSAVHETPDRMRPHLVFRAIREACRSGRRIERRAVDQVVAALASPGRARQYEFSGGGRAVVCAGGVWFLPREIPPAPPVRVVERVREGGGTRIAVDVGDDARGALVCHVAGDQVDGRWTVDRWRSGDLWHGGSGSVAASLRRWGVPPDVRRRLPVLRDAAGAVWSVAGLPGPWDAAVTWDFPAASVCADAVRMARDAGRVRR